MGVYREIWVESAKSRLPGLLPYIEFEDGATKDVFPSPDTVNGNYGKYVGDVVWRGERRSYRELMESYHAYRKNPPADADNVAMMREIESVIGIQKVDDPLIEGEQAPSFLYYAELAEWRAWFNQKFPFCSGGTENGCSDCCDCQRYWARGGNRMRDWLNRTYAGLVTTDAAGNEKWKLTAAWENGDQSMAIYPYYRVDGNGVKRLDARLNAPLLLTDHVDDMGRVSPLPKEWSAGTRYYGPWLSGTTEFPDGSSRLGEAVVYDGEVYFLKDNVGPDDPSWDLGDDEWRYEYVHGVDTDTSDGHSGQHAWFVGLYDLMYDEMLFDRQNADGTYVHWERAADNAVLFGKYFVDPESESGRTTVVETATASHLDTFKRLKTAVDDNGTVLPGILPVDENGNVTGDTLELPYLSGVALNVSMTVDEDGNITEARGDMITAVTFDEANRVVTFDYVIEGNLTPVNENGYAYRDGGVRYRDRYGYYVEHVDVNLSGETREFAYYDLDSGDTAVLDTLTDMSGTVTLTSTTLTTTYESSDFNEANTYAPTYRDEYLLGISSAPVVNEEVNVDRGTAAAMERHLKLGEIKTMEDMENYGNGFFNIVDVNGD